MDGEPRCQSRELTAAQVQTAGVESRAGLEEGAVRDERDASASGPREPSCLDRLRRGVLTQDARLAAQVPAPGILPGLQLEVLGEGKDAEGLEPQGLVGVGHTAWLQPRQEVR